MSEKVIDSDKKEPLKKPNFQKRKTGGKGNKAPTETVKKGKSS